MTYYQIETGSLSHPTAWYGFDDAALRVLIAYCDPSGKPTHRIVRQYTRLVNDLEQYYELQAEIQRLGRVDNLRGQTIWAKAGKIKTRHVIIRDGAKL